MFEHYTFCSQSMSVDLFILLVSDLDWLTAKCSMVVSRDQELDQTWKKSTKVFYLFDSSRSLIHSRTWWLVLFVLKVVKLGVTVCQGATIRRDEETGEIFIARVIHGGLADRSGEIQQQEHKPHKREVKSNNDVCVCVCQGSSILVTC